MPYPNSPPNACRPQNKPAGHPPPHAAGCYGGKRRRRRRRRALPLLLPGSRQLAAMAQPPRSPLTPKTSSCSRRRLTGGNECVSIDPHALFGPDAGTFSLRLCLLYALRFFPCAEWLITKCNNEWESERRDGEGKRTRNGAARHMASCANKENLAFVMTQTKTLKKRTRNEQTKKCNRFDQSIS